MAKKKNTRAASGSGSIRQRPDGRWEGRATVGVDPGTGKAIRRSVYGKSQREVRERLTEITNQVDRGTYSAPCKMKLGQWLDTWTEDYLGDVKESTAHVYREDVRLYIKPALGSVPLEALNASTIQKFINDLAKRLSPKTVSPKQHMWFWASRWTVEKISSVSGLGSMKAVNFG